VLSRETEIEKNRLAIISSSELKSKQSQTPLDSQHHEILILRASHSHLIDQAYKHYKAIWLKNPKDGRANFLLGEAALVYWEDSHVGKAVKLTFKRAKRNAS